MIILNGSYVFETEGLTEVSRLGRPKSFNDSINGYLIKTRSRFVRWRFQYTLFVDRQQKEDLEELFAETVTSLDLVDHRGFSWLTAAGTDDTTHAYATGADIEEVELVATPATPKNYQACDQRWRIPVTLIVSARGLAGNTANVIEASNCMVHDVPSGTINGVNATFTVTQTYAVYLLFVNGLEQKLTVDYNISGSTITFIAGAIPQTGDTLDGFGVP